MYICNFFGLTVVHMVCIMHISPIRVMYRASGWVSSWFFFVLSYRDGDISARR